MHTHSNAHRAPGLMSFHNIDIVFFFSYLEDFLGLLKFDYKLRKNLGLAHVVPSSRRLPAWRQKSRADLFACKASKFKGFRATLCFHAREILRVIVSI